MRSFAGRLLRGASRKYAGTVTHVATDDRLVALTFDDGPDPGITPELLGILKAHGAKATFFVTGENAAAHPEIVASIHEAGHAIGNHSWDHPSFPLIPGSERRRQIRRCAEVLPDGGARLFRPPYGHQSGASRWDAWLTGHEVIAWNVCIPDWEGRDGAWLADFAMKRLEPGSIVLMHDGMVDFTGEDCLDRQPTLDAVERILKAASHYEFVTVPALLLRGKPIRTIWEMPPDVGFLNQLKRRNGVPRRYGITG